MSRSDEQRLDDIREMCVAAAEIVARGRAALDEDPVLWLALERAVERAGEAATNLSAATRAQYSDVGWSGLIETRIIYAHRYHRIDRDLLWSTADRDLAAVLEALGPFVEYGGDEPG